MYQTRRTYQNSNNIAVVHLFKTSVALTDSPGIMNGTFDPIAASPVGAGF
ncbi:hypothetical protein EC2845650_3563 [Escherichia coli 2845650]|nr:hypothetical protein EC2845650_3563 [Escherichia coli 2845650]